MNKRLWKDIGFEQSTPVKFEDLLECSTIKVLENIHVNNNSVCHEQYGIFDNDLSLKNYQISYVKDKPSRIVISGSEVSVQMQRCDDQILHEKKKEFGIKKGTNVGELKLPIIKKQLVKQLALSVISLKQQLYNLKAIVEVQMQQMIRSMMVFLKKSLQIMINEMCHDKMSQRQPAVCQKCNCQGKLINSLTKQYWQLQKQIKEKQQIICDLNQKLFVQINKSNDPIKKIQRELLQQRAKTIQQLKSQIDILLVKNLNFQTELQDKEKHITQIEESYKQSLRTLNTEIQEINQVYSEKISKQLEHSSLIQNQLRNLQEKHEQCLYELEINKRENLRFNRKNQRQKVEKLNDSWKQEDELNLIVDRERYDNRKNFRRIKTDMNQFEQQQQYCPDFMAQAIPDSISMHNDRSLKYLNHRYTGSQYIVEGSSFKGNQINKSKMIEKPMLMKKNVNLINMDNRIHRTKSSMFERALTNLNEIQKDVRKQINRSKIIRK